MYMNYTENMCVSKYFFHFLNSNKDSDGLSENDKII